MDGMTGLVGEAETNSGTFWVDLRRVTSVDKVCIMALSSEISLRILSL